MTKNQTKANEDVNKNIEEEGGGEQTVAEAIKISTEKVFKTYDSRLRQIEQVQKKQFRLNCSGQELVGRQSNAIDSGRERNEKSTDVDSQRTVSFANTPS